jgi:hypothetical protein
VSPRQVAATFACGRIGLGLALALAPGTAGRSWIGSDSRLPGGRVAVRATGIRDIVMGMGLLMAMRRGSHARDWVEACIVADAGDAAFTLMSFGDLPSYGRFVTLASAAGSAHIGARIAQSIDGEHSSP